jgi:hypothetical protein
VVDPTGHSELFEHEIGVDEDIIETSLCDIVPILPFCPRLKPQG